MAMELLQACSRAAKALAKLEKASETWDFNSFEKGKSALAEEMSRLLDWEKQVAKMEAHLRDKEAVLSSDTYQQELEDALREVSLFFEPNFPVYRIPPFELRLVFDEKLVHLRLGRSTQKTGLFEPPALAKWVKKQYTSIVKRPFKARQFFSDLLSAYRVGNCMIYGAEKGQDVLWGRAVALKQIYELLTLRAETRAEYRKEHFVYDLARLRASGLTYDEYSVEFGYTKNQKGSFILPDLSSGREERFSTLTIYHNKEG